MLQKKSLIVIAGWGYPASALVDLCRALVPDTQAVALATRDLWLKGRPECGASEPGAAPLSCYAAGLRAFIREQGGAATVVGWSLGGMAALELAARCPENVERLALIASTPKFCSAADWTCGVPPPNIRAMRLGLQRNPDVVLADFYRLVNAPFAESAAELPDQALAGCDEMMAGLDYLLRMDLRPCLARIRIPVLIAHGREDRVIPWQAADYAHCVLSGSRLCLYDGVGHDLPLREPAKLAQDLRNLFFTTDC